ncbi:MAG: hypothetical protein KAQ96_12370 [Thermoplasmata archaeon]|nr:hypothetical protein [Thermoplasmata archaeon]
MARAISMRIVIPLAAIAVLVVIVLVIGSTLRVDDGDDGWEPSTYEEWLYDEYYNATEMGYDRSVWGGRVISEGDLESLINATPGNLTVPVFVNVPHEFTRDFVESTASRFFPEMDIDQWEREVIRDDRDNVLSIEYRNVALGRSFEVRQDGCIWYRSRTDHTTGDIFGSNVTAREHAIQWLEDRDALPEDTGRIGLWTYEGQHYPGTVEYELSIGRRVGPFDFNSGPRSNQIRLKFAAGTGQVLFFEHHWPELEIAFLVTNLPDIDTVLAEHDLVAVPKNNITVWFNESLVYDETSVIFDTGLKNSAEVYFFLPYRWMGLSYRMWESLGSLYGAIFPDAIIFYWD